MKRLLYLAPLIVVLVIVGYFASGLTRDPHELPSALIDRPFPAVDLPPISGHEKGFATADLAGQVALVNIFASWCVPCKVEHPLLMAHAKGGAIPIYGIAWKDDPAARRTCWRGRRSLPPGRRRSPGRADRSRRHRRARDLSRR
jgi:cytochrome c biogenesis protein CcmG/thiol:disulfide interchange protein DsbE